MTNLAKLQATNPIDQLGILLAQIADLEAQAEIIKNELKSNEGVIEGDLFRGVVTLSERKTVDNKAVFIAADVPAELIAKYTKTTAVITLKVTSR